MPVVIWRDGVREDLNRQRRDRLTDVRRPELIVECCEEQWRGFSRDARGRDENSGEDSGKGSRNNDAENRTAARRAESERSFPQSGRHKPNQLLGRPDDHRNHEKSKRETARDRTEAFDRKDCQPVREDSNHDRRHSVEHVGCEAHDRRKTLLAIFREVDAADASDRYGEQRGDRDEDERADDRVGHAAARLADGLRHLREERPVERRKALLDDVEQNHRERKQRQDYGDRAERFRNRRDHLSTPRVAHAAALRFVLQRRKREIMLIKIVMINSNNPISMSAWRYNSSAASVNSFAMTAAIVYCGAK